MMQLPGVKTKQIPVDPSSSTGQAEFCMYGRHIMMGYLKAQVRSTTHSPPARQTLLQPPHKDDDGLLEVP